LCLVPFIVSFIVCPPKISAPPFFETIMSVVLTLCAR
jgi:hypothetical protein